MGTKDSFFFHFHFIRCILMKNEGIFIIIFPFIHGKKSFSISMKEKKEINENSNNFHLVKLKT